MENPIKRFFERPRQKSDSLELNDKEISQLMIDIERVWMSEELPSGGYALVEDLKQLSESDSTQALSSLLLPYLSLNLEERLASVGIAVGELTPNRATPSGVSGYLRSGTPMVLLTLNTPEDFHRPIEIAGAIGRMIYGPNDESIRKFIEAFNSSGALIAFTNPDAIE